MATIVGVVPFASLLAACQPETRVVHFDVASGDRLLIARGRHAREGKESRVVGVDLVEARPVSQGIDVSAGETIFVWRLPPESIYSADGAALTDAQWDQIVPVVMNQAHGGKCQTCLAPRGHGPQSMSVGEACRPPEGFGFTAFTSTVTLTTAIAPRDMVLLVWPGECERASRITIEPDKPDEPDIRMDFRVLDTRPDVRPIVVAAHSSTGTIGLFAEDHIAIRGAASIDHRVEGAPCAPSRNTPFKGPVTAAIGLPDGRFAVAAFNAGPVSELHILDSQGRSEGTPYAIGNDPFEIRAMRRFDGDDRLFLVGAFPTRNGLRMAGASGIVVCAPPYGATDCANVYSPPRDAVVHDIFLMPSGVFVARTDKPDIVILQLGLQVETRVVGYAGVVPIAMSHVGDELYICAETEGVINARRLIVGRLDGMELVETPRLNIELPVNHGCGSMARVPRNGRLFIDILASTDYIVEADGTMNEVDLDAELGISALLAFDVGPGNQLLARDADHSHWLARPGQPPQLIYGSPTFRHPTESTFVLGVGVDFWKFGGGGLRVVSGELTRVALQDGLSDLVQAAAVDSATNSVVVIGSVGGVAWIRRVDRATFAVTPIPVAPGQAEFIDIDEVRPGVFVVADQQAGLHVLRGNQLIPVAIEWDDKFTAEEEKQPPPQVTPSCALRTEILPAVARRGQPNDIWRAVDGEDGIAWAVGCAGTVVRVFADRDPPSAERFAMWTSALGARPGDLTAVRAVDRDHVLVAERADVARGVGTLWEITPSDVDNVTIGREFGMPFAPKDRLAVIDGGQPFDIVGRGGRFTVGLTFGEVGGTVYAMAADRALRFESRFLSMADNDDGDVLLVANGDRLVRGYRCD